MDKLLDNEQDTAFLPEGRSGGSGHDLTGKPRQIGLRILNPNLFGFTLEGGRLLGTKVSLADLGKFCTNADAFVEVLNRHLYTYERPSSLDDGNVLAARARLDGDKVIIKNSEEKGV